MEFGDCGSLADLENKEPNVFSEQEIQYIVASILLGIAYLHDHKKIHRVSLDGERDAVGYQGGKRAADKGRKGQARGLWRLRQARHYLFKAEHRYRNALLDGSRDYSGDFLQWQGRFDCSD